MGGEHYGYIRVFNNILGTRVVGSIVIAEDNYQQLPEPERLKMTINGEPVAEIDIKASQLTIYHAMVGEPLEGSVILTSAQGRSVDRQTVDCRQLWQRQARDRVAG